MSEIQHEETTASPVEPLFTPEESNELSGLMLCFDGGMLDFGELDGFLSALAVAPQPNTLERWWTALFGPEPEWETEQDPERAKALVERYYAMVQARVGIDPHKLGAACMPPLEPFYGDEDEDGAGSPEGAHEYADEDLLGEDDDVADLASPAHHEQVAPQAYGGTTGLADADDEEDDDLADVEGDEDSGLLPGEDEGEEHIEADPEGDFDFEYAETWLSGFRYALSLQADDWRRVIDDEPALAPWLYLLWEAADEVQGEGTQDVLPAMAPTAAPPEDAGFLALEAALRERAQGQDYRGPLDEDGLMVLIPELLHQLWRRHRGGAGAVAAMVAERFSHGRLSLREADEDQLNTLLRKHAIGNMSLEYLDGWWTAIASAGEELKPLEQLDRILGPNKVWEDLDEASEFLHGLLRHWDAVVDRVAREPSDADPLCMPFIDFPPDEDPAKHPERPYGTQYALGFLAGIEELPRSARLLLMDPEARHWLAPFEALAKSQSLAHKGKRLRFEERMELIYELPECIDGLGGFWTGGGAPAVLRTPARSEPLPGRNDPCPCGSGKKYKKCHGAPERLN